MIKTAKRKKGVVNRLLNFWTSIVNALVTIILGGSMASGALALPTFLSFIPEAGVVAAGWTLVVIGMFNGVTSIIAFITK